jgi:hypothetical protein
MASYLILGAGKFGRLAVERLSLRDPTARFAIVDQSKEALAGVHTVNGVRVVKVHAEVSTFLKEHLPQYASWDWLIPMVPVHVALLSLQQGLVAAGGWDYMDVPEDVKKLAPIAIRGPHGELYLSRAGHLCPDDCPEPEDVCPVSGESRRPALYEELAALSLPGFQIRVMPSRQLVPGVGGYPPQELVDLARSITDVQEQLLVATACRCHGVVHALRRRGGRV